MKLDGTEVTLKFGRYGNGRLALQLFDEDNCPYTTVTVNLVNESVCNSMCTFIDTNNNGDDIITWLEDNGLGRALGLYGESGFCTYPQFEFNEEVVNI